MMQSNDCRWVRLGDYIERSMVNNSSLKYGVELIEGVNSQGEFCPPKANTLGINLKPYKVVQNSYFVYNPSRLNIGSLAYRTTGMCIVSHLYVVFHLNEEGRKLITPEFLLLYFKRDEFLRMVTYLNYGSQRPEFNFYDMSDIKIPLPSFEKQKELVATWQGLRDMKEENEQIADPLQSLCRSYLQDLKYKYPLTAIGEYIEEYDLRNSDLKFDVNSVRGISIEKKIIDTKANMTNVSLAPYKLFKTSQFCFVPTTSRNSNKITLALNSDKKTYLVSSSYCVFYITNEEVVLPQYLYLLLCKPEFDRYSRYNSWGSAREVFSYAEMCRVKIPIPPIEIQEAVVAIFRCADESRKIAVEANELSSTICPALIQKAVRG
ncbi:MAG: restriction endonuclease subunit S [Rikenellaceae bacterium]